jgi:hypothetical protein
VTPSLRVGCSPLCDRMRPSVRPLLTRAWIVQGVGQRKARSLEHIRRHASRRAVAAHEAEVLVRPLPTPLCIPASSPCRLARGLWCLAGRNLYDIGLHGSFPDGFSALRALTTLCAPVLFMCGCIRPLGACSGQRRIQTNRRLSKPWRLLERPQPRVRIGVTFGS